MSGSMLHLSSYATVGAPSRRLAWSVSAAVHGGAIALALALAVARQVKVEAPPHPPVPPYAPEVGAVRVAPAPRATSTRARRPAAEREAPPPRGTPALVPPVLDDVVPAGGPVAPPDLLEDLPHQASSEGPECLGCVPWGAGPPRPEAAPPAGGGGGEGRGGPVRIRPGGGVAPPVKLRDITPLYPTLALRAGLEGTVEIECTIDEDGRVVDARLIRGHPLFDRPALAAVRQWRYRPTLLNGSPVAVVMTVRVHFRLAR